VHFWPGGKKPVETVAPAPEAVPETLTPVPVPAPSDSTQSPAPPDTSQKTPAPPDTTQKAPAAPDSTQKAPVLQGASGLDDAPPAEESGFGAFGVPVPRSEDEGAVCAIREKRTLR